MANDHSENVDIAEMEHSPRYQGGFLLSTEIRKPQIVTYTNSSLGPLACKCLYVAANCPISVQESHRVMSVRQHVDEVGGLSVGYSVATYGVQIHNRLVCHEFEYS